MRSFVAFVLGGAFAFTAIHLGCEPMLAYIGSAVIGVIVGAW